MKPLLLVEFGQADTKLNSTEKLRCCTLQRVWRPMARGVLPRAQKLDLLYTALEGSWNLT
jgi:hypothetical protein